MAIKPIRPSMRMFSTDNKKDSFFDFLRKDEPEAEAT